MSNDKPKYFKDLVKKDFFTTPLLIAAFFLTAVYQATAHGLISMFLSMQPSKLFLFITVGFFALAFFIYVCFSSKKDKIGKSDHLALSFVFMGIGYAVMRLVRFNSFSQVHIIISVCLFIVGISLTLLNATNYKKGTPKEIKDAKGFLGYVKTLFAKCDFFWVICLAFTLFSLLLGFLEGDLFLLDSNYTTLSVFMGVCLTPYLVYSASSKKLVGLDTFIISLFVALLALSAIGFTIPHLIIPKLRVIIGLVLAFIFLFFIRCVCFDQTYPISIKPIKTKTPFLYYLASVNAKYPIISIIAIAGLLLPMGLLRLDAFIDLISSEVFFVVMPIQYYAPLLALLGTFVVMAVVSLCALKIKHVTLSDFAVCVLLLQGVLGGLYFVITKNLSMLTFSVILTVLSLILFVARTKVIFSQKN